MKGCSSTCGANGFSWIKQKLKYSNSWRCMSRCCIPYSDLLSECRSRLGVLFLGALCLVNAERCSAVVHVIISITAIEELNVKHHIKHRTSNISITINIKHCCSCCWSWNTTDCTQHNTSQSYVKIKRQTSGPMKINFKKNWIGRPLVQSQDGQWRPKGIVQSWARWLPMGNHHWLVV